MGIDVFLFASRHLLVVCTQTCIFPCCIIFEAVVCRLYEMVYPCICNVVISYWKSGAYGFVICRGGSDMCFVLGFGRKRPNLKQYRISGLTEAHKGYTLKNNIGENTSHSYWSWTHGPRGTTHGTSGKRP